MSSIRYLAADQVEALSSAPAFVKPGHCYWCNKPLTGKATKYCVPTKDDLLWDDGRRFSLCYIYFTNWWYQRPAYVRATFIRDNFTCQECGYHETLKERPWLPDMSKLECDHIIPLAKGGKTEMSNLQTLCKGCNRKKGVSVPGEPLQELPRVIPSRDNSKCPSCGAHGYRELPWTPPSYYNPLMKKVRCLSCGEDSYIGPKLKVK